MLSFVIAEFFTYLLPKIIDIVILLSPVWGVLFLVIIFWNVWLTYVRADFLSKQGYKLLEIELPKEQFKSPLAMELVLNTLNQTGGEKTFIDRYIKGKVRPWFSLELVSIEGNVHFFIWTRENFVDLVESQIYSQYPNSRIIEVEDYTNFLKYTKREFSLWGCEFKLTKADPYPIKTYVDYGLDEDLKKEEQKIDPITPTIEFLGSIGQKEYVWIQILVRANKKEKRKKGSWFKKTDWRGEAEDLVNELLKRDSKTKISEEHPNLTKEEQVIISAIQQSISKPGFDCGIRGIYLAETDKFKPINITGLTGTFKQYSSANLNGVVPTGGLTIFNYPWQDFKEIRQNKVRKELFDSYRRRSYFHLPYKKKAFVLSSEELATIFHFPGQVAQTPTFKRIESSRSEPPMNLPT
ncbi:hypothetical protein KJ991_02690 [Patescibacteria group bacterium]|nr:hypothetical protein [Patescibacteria group bacterium]MBU4057428.1 hypothetical protein [Patescibacteria group bacterium]MBU4115679.1 hypothetical protein [Patescibacteria group bacterium]